MRRIIFHATTAALLLLLLSKLWIDSDGVEITLFLVYLIAMGNALVGALLSMPDGSRVRRSLYLLAQTSVALLFILVFQCGWMALCSRCSISLDPTMGLLLIAVSALIPILIPSAPTTTIHAHRTSSHPSSWTWCLTSFLAANGWMIVALLAASALPLSLALALLGYDDLPVLFNRIVIVLSMPFFFFLDLKLGDAFSLTLNESSHLRIAILGLVMNTQFYVAIGLVARSRAAPSLRGSGIC